MLQFGGHHNVLEYAKDLPSNELMMYTWEDATLRELTDLVKSAQPAAKRQNARLEFALVYPDKKGRNVMRQVCYFGLQNTVTSLAPYACSEGHYSTASKETSQCWNIFMIRLECICKGQPLSRLEQETVLYIIS